MRSKAATIFLVSALAVATAFLSASANAETINVPFEFVAHGRSFPNGAYVVEKNPARHTVTLHCLKGNATLYWIMGAEGDANNGHLLLSFATVGEMHILKSIQYGRLFTVDGSPFQDGARNRAPMQP
jgi:hypothetical protein